MPSRRAYLTTLAAAGLAGCIGNPLGSNADSPTDTDTTTDSPTATPTDSPTDTATTTPTPSRPAVTVESAAVQYSYRHIENVDWNAVQTADGQFVFVTVDAREAEPVPEREAFSLVTDDERYDPDDIEYSQMVDLDVSGGAYAPEREDAQLRGWLLFEVPAQLESGPSLRLERDTDSWEWTIDAEKATTPPPAWEWTVSVPETVAPDETFDIVVSAENVGDGPGTFRGAVNFSHPMYRPKGFDIALDSGEAGEEVVSASSENAEPGKKLIYDVRTPAGESEVSVTVEADSTANESAT